MLLYTGKQIERNINRYSQLKKNVVLHLLFLWFLSGNTFIPEDTSFKESRAQKNYLLNLEAACCLIVKSLI